MRKPNRPAPTRFQKLTRQEEHDRPAVALHPRRGVAVACQVSNASRPISASGTTSSAEKLAPSATTAVGGAGEVQVMERAEHAARHEDDGREQHVDGRRARAHQPEA